ncbi:ABC transporter permease [Paraburkholderia phenoliruptrix]|uniref:ABC transporter permease n=1 Tax=Paraburkholderia phenoliruptrix TaxID=252970 RepID=UPI0028699DA7|nr:ABC transporter permease [Paraburkholderia phenoliruptrix]WMY11804.1 ABC transporter permease [Paraburkholderia phenoliruptrix]
MSTQTKSVAMSAATQQGIKLAAPAFVLLLLLAVISIFQHGFVTGVGLQVLSYQATPILILGLGQYAVIQIGRIDLSSATVAVLASVTVAKLLAPLGIWAPFLTIGVGALSGLVNGLIITYFQVPSFAVTLGAIGVWQSISLLISNQTTVYVSTNGGVIDWLDNWQLGGYAADVFVALALAVALWVVMRHTRFGTFVRAMGLNERAAILSGISTSAVTVAVFAMSGAFAALAGIVLTAQQGTASASGLGVGLLLPSIAAAICGGVALTGGVGSALNVIAGALIIALIPVGSSVVGIDPRYQQIVYGIVVILAVIVTIDRMKVKVVK